MGFLDKVGKLGQELLGESVRNDQSRNDPGEKIIKSSEYWAKKKQVRKEEVGVMLRGFENFVHIAALPLVLPARVITNVTNRSRGTGEKPEGFINKQLIEAQQNPVAVIRTLVKETHRRESDMRKEEVIPLRAKFIGIRKNYQRINERALKETPDHRAEVISGKLVSSRKLSA